MIPYNVDFTGLDGMCIRQERRFDGAKDAC
jgi:hypothetical protein